MTDTEVAPVEEKKTIAKTDSPKKAVKAVKKLSKKADHPSTAEMVTAAIRTLAERHGSSLQAIKKYIASTYKVDVDKQNMFIKRFLKSAVEKEILVQTKGKGASGSFKLASTKAVAKPKPKTTFGEKKPAGAKKPATKKIPGEPKSPVKQAPAKKTVAKKPSSPKKPAASKSPVKSKASASPKAKKATKTPTAKPKSPKPKKVTAAKTVKSPTKKAAAKK